MAYLGNSPVLSQQEYRNIDNISGSFNGSTTSFALLVNGVAPVPAPQSSNQCLISVNGVVQKPDDTGATGFRLSGGNIVFSAAPTSGQSFFGVILAGADYIYAGQNFPDGTVTAPPITFNQDLDTGFYRSGSGEVKFTANGANAITLSSNNLTAPSFVPTSSAAPTNGVYLSAANTVAIATNSTGKLFVNSSGQVGIGTSSPDQTLSVGSGSADTRMSINGTGQYQLKFTNSGAAGFWIGSPGANSLAFAQNDGTTRMTIDSSGRLGIGTTSPNANSQLHIAGSSYQPLYVNTTASDGGGAAFLRSGTQALYVGTAGGNWLTGSSTADGLIRSEANLIFATGGNTQRAQIDSSGRLLVGTSTSALEKVVIKGDGGGLQINRNDSGSPTSGQALGSIGFKGIVSANSNAAAEVLIQAVADEAHSGSTAGSRLEFHTKPSGTGPGSSPTERMRINSAGNIGVGNQVSSPGNYGSTGVGIGATGFVLIERNLNPGLFVNRTGDDGELVQFAQAGTLEGTISVSGTTVSYNGAHLSRWSQLSGVDPYNKTVRPQILRGTVMSNLDEMCEWGEEDNEQLNRMKVSDVEGDKNVSGVFQAWDDDDDTYTNDFYCAMTGDFIIRIGAGVTVERGDLLMSAGDGTAKPQDDDIIRSKTIAKVTSTNVSCTHPDGSYCVPCVLMAC